MKKKVLWMSLVAPYDNADNAGAKTHNLYIKTMSYTCKFDINLFSFCYEYEKNKLDSNSEHIVQDIQCINNSIISKYSRKLLNIESAISPFNKYAGIVPNYQRFNILKRIKKFAESSMKPDIIIIEWTQIIILLPEIKMLYPNSVYVLIEEDVSFLGYERKKNLAKFLLSKKIWFYKYNKLKNLELNCLRQGDLIVVNNEKDKNLLINNFISNHKIFVSQPYFTNYSNTVTRIPQNDHIVFYGYMARKENYLSVIWFIKNVFYKIKDQNLKLYIIGGNPHYSLKKYQSERIKILGFVENVSVFFSTCMCMVAPLILGAGIKIKVLESLSAGVPVLTNHIGIEGIPAKDGYEYIHCEVANDYITAINKLKNNLYSNIDFSNNGKAFINNNFNISNKTKELIERIEIL